MDLEQYRLIVESSPNMVWRSNLTTECDYFNKTWLDFTGRSMSQEYGFGWAAGVHPDDYERCVKIYLESFDRQQAFEMDYRLKRYDGQFRWINDRGVPFYDREAIFIGFIGSCVDITEKIEGQRLKEMAQNDALCRTYNRQYSYELLDEIFREAREGNMPMSLLMMDLDDFKKINDEYGHTVGDKVLASFAASAKKEMRTPDIIGRYGGDEFLAGLVQTNRSDAMKVGERIRKDLLENPILVLNNSPIKITVSIGIKSLENEVSLEELIEKADKKLYEAKKAGKNLVRG